MSPGETFVGENWPLGANRRVFGLMAGVIRRAAFACCLALVFLLALPAVSAPANPVHEGLMEQGRLFVPLRGVFQELGMQVSWNPSAKTVSIAGQKDILLRVGSAKATVGGKETTLDEPPLVRNGTVFVPLRFCAEALGSSVDWNPTAREALIESGDKVVRVRPAGNRNSVNHYVKKIDGVTASVVEIPRGSLRPDVVLGQNRVGGTEELASMASRSGAVVAINGTFFEAYGGIPEPWGTLIKDGRVVHIGNTGTVAGFTANGTVKFARLKILAEGTVNNRARWYAYGFNRTPNGVGAFVFTKDRGARLGFDSGTSIVVEQGKVKEIVRGDVAIPADGYVINFTGPEEYQADRFKVGDAVDYRVVFEGQDWSNVVTAVGAGPRLITNGIITVDPKAEGFSSPKILSMAGARSAIGVKTDGTVFLVTVPSATIERLAHIMQELGARDAMNLDGGASSGLWLSGKYVTRPGRLLSNALVFLK